MNRRKFLSALPGALLLAQAAPAVLAAPAKKKGVMLFNRIGPKSQELYVSNLDGSNERKFLANSVFDYHAAYAPDGRSVVFTSERNGLGNSDIFRARADGTGVEALVTGGPIDDSAQLSPDGTKLVFVSSREIYYANIWLYDLRTKKLRSLTDQPHIQGDKSLPNGFFKPSWSPDSQWIAFSSDRNTDWRGHDNGAGWEHTQELSVYVIKADGTGFRRIASKPGYCLGSPKWSPDGKRVVFYEITTEDTWGARRPEAGSRITSQIVSVDVATGERVQHTSTPGLKIFPQFLSPTEIAYHRKGGADQGLYYTSGRPSLKRDLRSPTWSPDGKTVIYEKVGWDAWEQNRPLWSWDKDWDYKYSDVWPTLARDGTMAITAKDANSSIDILNSDGSGRKRIYDATQSRNIDQLQGARVTINADGSPLTEAQKAQQAGRTGGAAFYPTWSPDSQWVAFGVGQWFQLRASGKAVICMVRRDGTGFEVLTDGAEHSGFPSWSADGKEIVFRVWGDKYAGLRVLNLETRKIRTLTTEYDNLPAWSPDGQRIMFTRRVDAVNFDIFTIRPDGSDLTRLTTNRGNDGHSVWTADGRIMFDGSEYGWRDEAVLYDNTFQPYGQVWVMNADGSGKRMLTDSLWEDTTPLYLPARA